MNRKPINAKTTRVRKTESNDTSFIKSPTILLSQIKIDIKHKNETQKKLTNSIKNNDVTICTGPAGCGKAQPLDSMILTANGFKKMGDINIGDEVISIDGTPTKVLGVYPQGLKDIYEITFSDGAKTEACGEHLWLTQTINDRLFRKRPRTKDGLRKRIGDTGREGSVKSTEEILNTLMCGKHTNHSIPITKPVLFCEKELLIDPYVLGLLLGDGGLTTNISFTTADIEIIDELKKRLGDKYIIERYNGLYNYKIVTKRGVENPLLINIENFGLRGLKSDEKFIPEIYKRASIEQRIELLQGLMDTDGTINIKSGSPIYYTTSKRLSEDIKFLVQSLGGTATITNKIGKYKKDGKIVNCKLCYSVFIRLPNDITPVKLKRKIKLLKPKTKYKVSRFITSVKLIGQKEAQCIMVDHNSHLYLTDEFIVTHNTYIAVAEAIKLLKDNLNYEKIVIIKSVTNLKGEDIGFLRGTLDEKMEPFIYSFISNFNKLIGVENTNMLKENKIIETLPIAYLRGVSIDNSIIIVDEIQNITHDNMKTILTRLGENSKLILLGDTEQIDIKNKKESSVSNLINKIKLKPSPNVGIIEFTEAESVRHKLTPYFIDLLREVIPIEKSIKTIEKKSKKDKKISGIIGLIRNFFIK